MSIVGCVEIQPAASRLTMTRGPSVKMGAAAGRALRAVTAGAATVRGAGAATAGAAATTGAGAAAPSRPMGS